MFSKARTVGTDFKEAAEEEDVIVYGTFAYGDSRNHAKLHGETGIDRLTAVQYTRRPRD